MRGLIFDIQRFSVHDGPGIRTAVFLKGCSLECAWCQNPEGISRTIRLWHFERRCCGCGECISVCPESALSSGDPLRIIIDQQACNLCARCLDVCPTGALAFDGREVESSDVIAEVERDRLFYEVSGGGITLTGGEPLCQPEVSAAILRGCRERGISTVVETALAAEPCTLDLVAPLVDLFLVDLKLAGAEEHLRWTGMAQHGIFRNFEELVRRGSNIRVRVPLVPGVTASEGNLRALYRYIRSVDGQIPVELVNFNPLAREKYRRMGIPYLFDYQAAPFSESDLDRMKGYLHDAD